MYYLPYSYYPPEYRHRRYYPDYWYPYEDPYANAAINLINSQIASNNQSIFNAGVMTGVTQVANALNISRRRW